MGESVTQTSWRWWGAAASRAQRDGAVGERRIAVGVGWTRRRNSVGVASFIAGRDREPAVSGPMARRHACGGAHAGTSRGERRLRLPCGPREAVGSKASVGWAAVGGGLGVRGRWGISPCAIENLSPGLRELVKVGPLPMTCGSLFYQFFFWNRLSLPRLNGNVHLCKNGKPHITIVLNKWHHDKGKPCNSSA